MDSENEHCCSEKKGLASDNYFDQFSTSESGSPLLSRLDVQSKLKPSNSGQSTDSGIVADNDQDSWSVSHSKQDKWEASYENNSIKDFNYTLPTTHGSNLNSEEENSLLNRKLKYSSKTSRKSTEGLIKQFSNFDLQMKNNFVEAKARVEKSLLRLQKCQSFKEFQTEFSDTGKAIVDLACESRSTQQSSQKPLSPPRSSFIATDAEIAIKFGLEIKSLSNKCCRNVDNCNKLSNFSKQDHLVLGIKKISVQAWKTYLFTRAEPPLLTSTDLFRSVYESSLTATNCADLMNNLKQKKDSLDSNIETTATKLRSVSINLMRLMRSDALGREAVFQKVLSSLEGICSILELINDFLLLIKVNHK